LDTIHDLSLLLFIKSPEKGSVKSRLAASVGEETALEVYKNFVLDLVAALQKGTLTLRIYFSPEGSKETIENWLPRSVCIAQEGKDLGERMENAFLRSFSSGFQRALLIGSDIPDLPVAIIDEAAFSLEESDAVIGPSSDGGYYLIGFRNATFLPDVFHGIRWGTASVFRSTMEVFERSCYRVHVLPLWHDVDTVDDLRSLFTRNRSTGFRDSRTMAYLMENRQRIFSGSL